MTENGKTTGSNGGTSGDMDDIASLRLDPALGDGLTDTHYHTVPVGKPKDFFRVHPEPAYRCLLEIYTHKVEGMIEETHYVIEKAMQGAIAEARRCSLVTCIYRDGSPRLWPLKLPNEGEHDNTAWVTARAAAKAAMQRWVRLVWARGNGYLTREAQDGYAPEPDWGRLPPYSKLVVLGFGEHGIIRDRDHPIYRDLFGMAQKPDNDGLS